MKEIYKGYEIEVTREKCLGGWDQLFMSIYRISDGYCVEDTFSDGDDTEKEMMGYMKERLDTELEEHGEGEWFYEEDEE